jgi:hypothetical protein
MDAKYAVKALGKGHGPHVLQNVDNPEDIIELCSCGGTRDPRGYCDGAHKQKVKLGCSCLYCQKIEDRVKTVDTS